MNDEWEINLTHEMLANIEVICGTYAAKRDSYQMNYPPPTHMEFITFCNAMGSLLERELGDIVDEEIATDLFRLAHTGVLPEIKPEHMQPFAELLGIVVGLKQQKRKRIAAQN